MDILQDVAPSNLLVRVGEYNVLDGIEAHPHIDRRITRLVTHSSFDRASYEYDIALLKMVAPVSFQVTTFNFLLGGKPCI